MCEEVERPVHRFTRLPDIDQDHTAGNLMDPVGLILVGSGLHGTLVPCSLVRQERPRGTDLLGHGNCLFDTWGYIVHQDDFTHKFTESNLSVILILHTNISMPDIRGVNQADFTIFILPIQKTMLQTIRPDSSVSSASDSSTKGGEFEPWQVDSDFHPSMV